MTNDESVDQSAVETGLTEPATVLLRDVAPSQRAILEQHLRRYPHDVSTIARSASEALAAIADVAAITLARAQIEDAIDRLNAETMPVATFLSEVPGAELLAAVAQLIQGGIAGELQDDLKLNSGEMALVDALARRLTASSATTLLDAVTRNQPTANRSEIISAIPPHRLSEFLDSLIENHPDYEEVARSLTWLEDALRLHVFNIDLWNRMQAERALDQDDLAPVMRAAIDLIQLDAEDLRRLRDAGTDESTFRSISGFWSRNRDAASQIEQIRLSQRGRVNSATRLRTRSRVEPLEPLILVEYWLLSGSRELLHTVEGVDDIAWLARRLVQAIDETLRRTPSELIARQPATTRKRLRERLSGIRATLDRIDATLAPSTKE